MSNTLDLVKGALSAVTSSATPISAGLQLASTVAVQIGNFLDRKDRDEPENYLHEKIVQLQNFFANNQLDTDDFRLWLDGVLNDANAPLTPARDPVVGRRELLHSLIVAAIQLTYERKLASRLLAKIK